MELYENSHSYFYGQFPAKGCRDWVAECSYHLAGQAWQSGVAIQMGSAHPAQSPARPFEFSESQVVEPEPKGCSHCDGPAVLEWTLISLPNHNPVWFGFVVVFTTQQEIGTRVVTTP